MSVLSNMTGKIDRRQLAMVFMGNLTAALGLHVVGYPLTPTEIRATVLAWSLSAVAVAQLILGHRFRMTAVAATIRTGPRARRATVVAVQTTLKQFLNESPK